MAEDRSYWAFLSYSHRDKAMAEWLHRALESFRLPKELVGRRTEAGEVPAALRPVFRDRDELAASDDLGQTIRTALAASRSLIVLCSPSARASRWTNEEVRSFKALNPSGRVLAAIVSGEPFASEMPGREEEECFPPALRHRIDAEGRVTDERAEPIAADFRDGGDGKRMGLLKLVAGLLALPLDDLVRREAVRRQRRLTWLAAASLAGMAVTSGLAVAAVQGRNEAREQRAQAEGLVGFMLGDLRSKLEPLGRLDVLDSVGARALAYYQRQDKESLSEEGLAQRSRALTLIGEIANLRGDLGAALSRYTEARAGTAEALMRSPDDQQRIFDHAQNVFWVGYIAWQRGRTAEAEAEFAEYKRLANRLVALDPNKPKWQLEGVYADTNLGTLLLEKRQWSGAAQAFESALRGAEKLAASEPGNRQYQDIVSESLAYLADAQKDGGKLEEALGSRERQLEVLARMAKSHGNDAAIKRRVMAARQSMGILFATRGDAGAGLDSLREATRIAVELRQIEPDNTEWLAASAGAQADLASLLLAVGRTDEAEHLARASCDIARQLSQRDSSVVVWRFGRMGECLRLRAQAAAARGHRREALAIALEAVRLAEGRQGAATAGWSVPVRLLAGDQYQAMGKPAAARAHWSQALNELRTQQRNPNEQFRYFLLLKRLGHGKEAAAVASRLDSIGYRHPTYLEAKRSI